MAKPGRIASLGGLTYHNYLILLVPVTGVEPMTY